MGLYASDATLMKRMKDELGSKFEVKFLGPIRRIVGIEIKRDLDAGTLTIHQEPYILKMLSRFTML